MTPQQLRTRRQVESVIRIAAPALNLVLAVGERVSRVVEREDQEYYPPRGGAAGSRGHGGDGRADGPPR